MAFTLKAGGSCGFLYLRACAVDRSTNQAQLKDMLRLDRLPSPYGDFFLSNGSVPQRLVLPSSRAPQSSEQKFTNRVRNYSPKTTQEWDEFDAKPVECYNPQPVPRGHGPRLLSENIDLLRWRASISPSRTFCVEPAPLTAREEMELPDFTELL